MAITMAQYAATLLAMPSLTITVFAPDVQATPCTSGKTWRCDTGRHHWHRSERRARWCAWEALPAKHVSWRHVSELYGEAT